MPSGRYFYIDALKVIAIFLVIVNHTNSSIFINQSPSFEWFASVAYFYVSKIAVPIFIMCTGALILSRVDSYRKHISRVFRGVITLTIASFVYYYIGNGFKVTPENLNSFLHYFINKPTSNAMWYLYLYIGIVSVMPFLQRLSNCMTKRDTEILIFLSLIAPGLASVAGHFMHLSLYERADFFIYSYPIGYLFLGYYINKYSEDFSIQSSILFSLFLISTAISTSLTYIQFDEGYTVSLYWSYLGSLTVVIPSASIFYLLKRVSDRGLVDGKSSIISTISLCTFGMYLFSDMVMILTGKYYTRLSTSLNPLLSCFIWQISIFTLAFIASFLARKIPVVKRYL